MRASRLCGPAVALLFLTCLHLAPGLAASVARPIPVSGQVLGPGSVPLAGARVLLMPVQSLAAGSRLELEGKADATPVVSVSTGADGSFLLEAPEPGMWKVVVEARGMVSQEMQLLPLIEEIELPAAVLERDAGLEVRVTGPDGGLLPGVRVRLRGAPDLGELSMSGWQAPVRIARTDEKGVAVLPREAGETLFVQAGIEGRPIAEAKEVTGSSVTLRLPAGTTRQIRVVDATGKKPVPGVLVSVGDERWCAGQTSAEGLFSVSLPEGRKQEALRLAAEDGRFLEASLGPPAREDKGPQVLSLPALEIVDGRVVSAADGQPIAGALVWNLDHGMFRRSGPDGSYRLRLAGVPGFPRAVQAAAPGFLVSRGQMSTGGLPQGPTVALEPSWDAGGVVQDEQGQPVAGVTVQALPQSSMFGPESFEARTARTAPSGRFRIRRLDSGIPYQLRLSKPGFAQATAELPPLTPGRPVSDLRIVLRKGRTGFGRVVNRAEQPVPGATVVLRPAFSGDLQMQMQMMMLSLHDEDMSYEAATGADGRFEIRDLPAGTWGLAVQAKGYALLRVPGLEVPEGSGSTDLGTVILAPGTPVEGYVVDREGQPIAGAEVQASEADAGFTSFLEMSPPPATVTAADGYFRIEDRRTGETINLVAGRTGYAPAGLPGVEVPAKEPVRMVLQAASVVEGRTVGADGEPLANAMVFVLPADLMSMMALGTAGMSHPEPAMSGADGSFRIENVAPGAIELHAMALGRLQALLKNLEVQPGKDLTGVEIVLAPGAVVEGRVLSPSGKPVAGAEVDVVGSDSMMEATSDGDGHYRLEGISPGIHLIEAAHKSYLPARRQLAVRAGDNALDFKFEEGSAQISGRVVDEAGAPVASARVTLQKEGWGPSEPDFSVSGTDGTFTLSGVPDGVYQLFAEKRGFARSREGKLITVDGSSVEGLEVRLTQGGSIVGSILGLDFADLSRVQVMAEVQVGQVMPDGSYRIDHVAPGEPRVTASLSGRAREVQGQVVLEPGVPEVRLDLEFREGFTLSGRVLLNGEPLQGRDLYIFSRMGSSPHWAKTDYEGRFRFEKLEAGSYSLHLIGSGARSHKEELEIVADQDVLIDLRAASIAGRVVDAADRRPLASAMVTARAAEEDHPQADTTTDSRGVFVLRDVPEGAWKVEASLTGFAPAEVDVQTAAGAPVEGVELALQAAEGLTLEVVLPSGQPPGAVGVWVVDTAGRLVASGVHSAGADGRVRIPDVPSGLWDLILDIAGSPLVSLPVSVPGHTGRVILPEPSALDLRVVPLVEEGTAAKVRLIDESGRMFRVPGPGGVSSELLLHAGSGRFERIPAGTWIMTVTTDDDRIWTEHLGLAPGETARVALEAPR